MNLAYFLGYAKAHMDHPVGPPMPRVASLEKDVIAPYKHMAKTFVNDSAGFEHRPTLLYFRGAIYRKEVIVLAMSLEP